MVAPRTHPTLALVEELLAEQQRLHTPVARYAQAHGQGSALAPVYRDLIPLTAPARGEQYAFEVDLDSCSGCKACVAGCHALNGLDEHETWRDVGTVVSRDPARPFQQTITTACHHCADPGCLNGCPVLAYEKDPVTGVVRHLDDQCIGCSYCILKCPYDVPKYSERLGIVRKCDLCHSRLAAGEAPACVQSCPTQAIRIVKVPVEGRRTDTSAFLPQAPDPAPTQPTTRFLHARELPEFAPATDTIRPETGHAPLSLLFLGTQAAVGLQVASAAGAAAGVAVDRLAVCMGLAGLTASVFHLGRPLRAWRVFLGLRRSWLSREALVFGAWMAVTLAGLIWTQPPLAASAAALGLLGVFCSAMIYIDTGRRYWGKGPTFLRFFGTTGLAAAAVAGPAVFAVTLAAIVLLEWTMRPMLPSHSRLVVRGPLRRLAASRRLFQGLALAGCAAAPWETGAFGAALAFTFGAEAIDKFLFFRAVDPSRMPGVNIR